MRFLLILLFVASAVQARLVHVAVRYVDPQGRECKGELVCNSAIAADLTFIFDSLYRARYPIGSVRPISDFADSDERSMAANNTSCYCYRRIAGQQRLSRHATGMAIDINPLYNPQVKHGRVSPPAAKPYAKPRNQRNDQHNVAASVSWSAGLCPRAASVASKVHSEQSEQLATKKHDAVAERMMIHHGDLVWRLFHDRGFRWGGDWRSSKDYQHFEK